MSPKEKAAELINKFTIFNHEEFAISNALICVDEILESKPSYQYWHTYDDETPSANTFWNEVKQELKNKKYDKEND